MPKGGGMSVTCEGKLVQVITPQAPLGEALIGRRVGDSIDVSVKNIAKEYVIESVW